MLENLKNRLLTGWTLMRIIRLGLASLIMVQAITNNEIVFAIIGGVLLFQAAFNYGCCGTSGCDINHSENKSKSLNQNQNNITYTEVK